MQIDSIDEAIAAFAAAAQRYLAHDRLSVYLLTSDGKHLERLAVATSPRIPGERDLIPIEEVGLAYVLNADLALVSADLATDPRIVGREDLTIAGAGFHGLMSVPLRIGDQPIGVLNFVSAEVGFYSEEDQVLAQQIADTSAAFFQLLRTAKHGPRVPLESGEGGGFWNLAIDLLQRIESERGIKTSYDLSLDRSRLDAWGPDRERAAWRVTQEALTNAVQHSHATRLRISLGVDIAGDDSLVIKDDGVGFDVAAIDPASQSHGFSRMRGEAESVGGHLFITTSAGNGTTVCLRVQNLQPTQDAKSVRLRPAGTNAGRAAKAIRTLVAAGQPVLRDGLMELLGHQADIRVVGRSSTVPETIAQARRLLPDVVLAGASLVHATEGNLVTFLHELSRPPKVLLLSEGRGDDRVAAAMAAGAHGYLSFKVSIGAITDAIRAVHRGASIVDGAAAEALWHRPAVPPLSMRDVEIVRRVAEGETNAEIARTLNVSEKTVEAALGGLLRKLTARNRAHLVSRALEVGILEGKPL